MNSHVAASNEALNAELSEIFLNSRPTLGLLTHGGGDPVGDEYQAVGIVCEGKQQKNVLARWLGCDPRILFLDEPIHGIDVGAKFEIYQLMRTLADSGIGILLISSELPEIMAMSDRIAVTLQEN